MNKRVRLLFILMFFLLVSCAQDNLTPNRKINVISVGIDYVKTNYNSLKKNIDDAVQVGLAIDAVSKEDCSLYFLVGSTESNIQKYKNIVPEGTVFRAPTIANFNDTVSQVASSATKEDLTVIYVSTHGSTTYDIEYNGVRHSYGEAVRDDASIPFLVPEKIYLDYYIVSDFMAKVSEIPGIKLVIGDFCFSGAMVEPNGLTIDKNQYSENFLKVFSDEFKVNIDPTVFCIAASEYFNPSQIGTDCNNSHFTKVLLNALGWENDNVLDAYPTGVKAAKGNYLTFGDLSKWIYNNGGNAKFDSTNQCITCNFSSLDVNLFKVK